MPIAILGIFGFLISILIIFFFLKDPEYRGYERVLRSRPSGDRIIELITAIIMLIVAIISLIEIYE